MNNQSAIRSILRRWWIVALFVVAGLAVTAAPEPAQVEETARSFAATHTMLINDSDSGFGGNTAVSPSQVTLLATTGEVPLRVAQEIDFDGNPASLARQISAEFDFSTGALRFSTTQQTAERAELVADTFAEVTNSYLAERQDVVYQDRLAASLDRLAALEADLDELTRQLAFDSENITLRSQRDAISRQYSVAFEQNRALLESPPILGFTTLERAQAIERIDRGLSAPTTRSSRAAMGALAGLAIGAGIAVVLGRLDRRIRTRDQAEEVLGLRARATIPKTRDGRRDKLVVTHGRHDPLSDSFRTVRNVVGFVHNSLEPVERARVTVVVSPGPGDGKTTLATNLAAAFVETGRRTIAVNTDFRRPRLAKAVDDNPGPGHPFVLEDLSLLAPKSLLTRTETQGLLLFDLSSIDASAGELVRATTGFMPQLSEIADEIVVDTSPVGATAEVLEMVPFADVILVSVRLGHTSIASARRTAAVLRDVTTVPILLVINSVKQERASYYEYTDRHRVPDEAGRSGRRLWRGGSRSRDVERVG